MCISMRALRREVTAFEMMQVLLQMAFYSVTDASLFACAALSVLNVLSPCWVLFLGVSSNSARQKSIFLLHLLAQTKDTILYYKTCHLPKVESKTTHSGVMLNQLMSFTAVSGSIMPPGRNVNGISCIADMS